MELFNDPLRTESERIPESSDDNLQVDENDPELEREYEELAQWLLEAYLYRRWQKAKADDEEIDKEHRASTI